MTVNELFSVWLHNKNPYTIINVWDRGIGDYIFKTNPPIPNQNAEEIGKMEVKCFFTKVYSPNSKELLIHAKKIK